MRSILGALFLTLLALVSPALAQVSGRVESIGFGGDYRPGCWTPMVIGLTPSGAPTGFYEIRVWQHDLDGDLPYYSTRISLTGAAGEQLFWTYFIPEPIYDGLTSDTSTAAELAQRLRITIHDAAGRELAMVPLGSKTMHSIETPPNGTGTARGTRMVLMVGTAAMPATGDYEPSRIIGIKENLASDRVTPDRLPENVIGYDGVDAVVWLEGDPATLSASGGRRFDALRDYVRRGGHLVISTPAQWQQILGFDDLLPVDITGTEQSALQSPLREITGRIPFPTGSVSGLPARNPWDRYQTPQTIAVATPRVDAVVDEYSDRVENAELEKDRTPWLVRRAYGFGCVTWVAQDLGSRELVDRANWGWPAVWEEVLGSESTPIVEPTQKEKIRFDAKGARELGFVVLDAMNLTGRAATLIAVTVLFFVAYWLLAGPGLFFWLKYKHRTRLNWFLFGGVALVATAVTLGLVKLLLRGKPEMTHISLVRVEGDRTKPATVASRIGMYVPRDGPQRIEIPATASAASPPTLTPFPIHPALHRSKEGDKYLFAAPRDYRVAVPMDEAARSMSADVPFRTTMKRLQADWTGAIDDRIEGRIALQPSVNNQGYISGVLHNLTGKDLRNIYVAFRHQPVGGKPIDWMMFVYEWKAGDDLDLGKAFNPFANQTTSDITVGGENRVSPNRERPVRGWLSQWIELYKSQLQPANFGGSAAVNEDLKTDIPISTPLLSFFNRFPLLQNEVTAGSTRAELYRSGLREWDMSNALIAGKLVVVAQADRTELPLPLTVDGDPVSGPGRTIYQFVLPLTPIVDPATTRPTTKSSN